MQFTNDPKLDLRRTFRKPSQRSPGKAPLLALLRTDLQQLYGTEAVHAGPVPAPLLAALGTCVGFELLAKYWSGCPDVPSGTVHDFLTTVVGLTPADAEVLIQFRNSLAHGYALGTRRRKDNRPFSFAIDTSATASSSVISHVGASQYVINLWSLKRLFRMAIRRCRKEIGRDQYRLGDFQVCIRNLGEIAIAQ